MSLFVTLEGGEGCGKSLQAKMLYDRLCRQNIPAVLTFEPGGTPLGDEINHWLKWREDSNITPLTELLLFNASRSQLIADVIKPALAQGKVVVCDRFADSTTVYQGYGRGLDMDTTLAINRAATGGLTPHLTILLDMPPDEGFDRKRADKYDRFEKEKAEFHQRIRQGYLKLAAQEPARWVIIDATQSKEDIADSIWGQVSRLLPGRS
jgi:dTMP kinase